MTGTCGCVPSSRRLERSVECVQKRFMLHDAVEVKNREASRPNWQTLSTDEELRVGRFVKTELEKNVITSPDHIIT